jgi:DNA-binding MurR/RpiR family transcriptional regulator
MSAAEFAAQPPFGLSEHSLVVAVSHSGTTQEVLDAILLARQRGAYTFALRTGVRPRWHKLVLQVLPTMENAFGKSTYY